MGKKVEAFMDDLQLLYVKYGLFLDSCGCCDSITIYKKGRIKVADRLEFEDKENLYKCEVYKHE